jgi:hypothetical protein
MEGAMIFRTFRKFTNSNNELSKKNFLKKENEIMISLILAEFL